MSNCSFIGKLFLGQSADDFAKLVPHGSNKAELPLEALQLLEFDALWSVRSDHDGERI